MYDIAPIVEDCERLYDRVSETVASLREKRVLITGANGLIGGFIADFLAYLNDHHDYKINIHLTSLSEPKSAARIVHLLSRKDVTYTSWDLTNPVPEGTFGGFDFVFFMSGYGQPKKFISQKMKTISLNTVGLNSLIAANVPSGCNFLFASTSEIYGDPTQDAIPTREDYNGNYSVESNRACYISSKRLGEVMCLENSRDNPNCKFTIARIALAYGPGVFANDDRVMQDFIIRGKEKGEIKLMDRGEAIRNYIYIVDCVQVLLEIAIKGKHKIYNVGGDTEEVTILDLAHIVGSVTGVDVKTGDSAPTHTAKSPSRVCLDMSRYNSEFGRIANPTMLTDGIRNTARWLRIL